MINLLKDWPGKIEIDGTTYNSISEIDCSMLKDDIHIKLLSSSQTRAGERPTESDEHVITVKSYMTKHATEDFDFMRQWNNDIPMPLITMVGTKERETRGMVYMKLHGDILAKTTEYCMKCGKPIENPVSKFFGMGPICGNHNYVNPFASDEELQRAVDDYRKELQNITWEGWIIKSAIISDTLLDDNEVTDDE